MLKKQLTGNRLVCLLAFIGIIAACCFSNNRQREARYRQENPRWSIKPPEAHETIQVKVYEDVQSIVRSKGNMTLNTTEESVSMAMSLVEVYNEVPSDKPTCYVVVKDFVHTAHDGEKTVRHLVCIHMPPGFEIQYPGNKP